MATGKEMLAALRQAVQRNSSVRELRISPFDASDLFKLQPNDLKDFGADVHVARVICQDLARRDFGKLSEWLEISIVPDTSARNLIPGEGIRRTAGVWATGNDDPDAIVDEIRRMRNAQSR